MKKLAIITILLMLIAGLCFAAASDYKVDSNGNIYGYGLHILTTGTFLNILSGTASFQTPLGISSGGTGTNVAISMVNSFNTRTGAVTLTSADVASVYTGSTNLTILGTIATGTVPWSHVSSYSTVNDTNVTLSISSSGAHTVGWTGTLADGRIASATNWNDAYNKRVSTWQSPLSYSSGTVSISKSTSTVDGYLSSTDWGIFNAKQNPVAANAPLSFSTPTMSISLATTTVDGYISAASYSTFNAKQAALNGAYVASFNSSTGTITTPTVNDTNVTLSMASGQTQTITVGWTGTLADGRIASAATWNAKQNAIAVTAPLSFSTPTISISTSPTFSTVILSNLTTSYVPVSGASGLVNSNIYYDGSNIGIDTSTPITKLNIMSSSTITVGFASVILDGSNNTERIETRSANNVGGSCNPIFQGRGAAGTALSPADTPNNYVLSGFGGGGYVNGSWVLPNSGLIAIKSAETWTTTATGSYIEFETTQVGGTSRTEKMRLMSNGNLGIGTTNPATKLAVNGSFSLIGTGAGILVSDSSGTITSSTSPSISGLTTSGTVTGGNFYTAGTITASFFSNTLSGITNTIGGASLGSAGTCTTATATVTGATIGMGVFASPSDGVHEGLVTVTPYISASDTVKVDECAIAAVTPAARRYYIRVIK